MLTGQRNFRGPITAVFVVAAALIAAGTTFVQWQGERQNDTDRALADLQRLREARLRDRLQQLDEQHEQSMSGIATEIEQRMRAEARAAAQPRHEVPSRGRQRRPGHGGNEPAPQATPVNPLHIGKPELSREPLYGIPQETAPR